MKKVVLVTGASSGIGRATAIQFAKKGYKVVIAARSEDRLREVHESIKKWGGDSYPVVCDVNSNEQIEQLVMQAIQHYGQIDVAILNAGVQFIDSVHKLNLDEVELMYRTNVLGVIACTRFILPEMLKRKEGQIVIVSSTMGDAAFPMMVPYGSTKAAVSSFARGLRREVGKDGIEVMLFVPGHTKTSISNHLQDRIPEWYGKSAGSLTAEEVANTLYFAVQNKKQEVYVGRQSVMLSRLVRYFPKLADNIIKKITLHS